MAKFNLNREIIKANIKAQMEGKFVAPMVLIGAPGLGKTSLIKAIAKELGIGLLNQSIAALDSAQLSGLPEFYRAEEFDKYNVIGQQKSHGTVWTVPELIMQANKLAEEKGGCILLLDDIHEASMGVQPYLYEMLLERKLGQYKFHDKVALVATANNSDEANFRGFSSAIINRLALYEYKFDFNEWFDMIGATLHPIVSSFIKAYPHHMNEAESTEFENYLTPRSIHFLSETLNTIENEKFIVENAFVLATQYMSKNAAKAFEQHAIQFSKYKFAELVKSQKVIDLAKKEALDQILFAYITRYIKTQKDGVYMLRLFAKNYDIDVFIGIVTAIIGNLYQQSIENENFEISEGLKLFLNALLGDVFDIEIKEEIQKELDKALKELPDNAQERIIDTMADFISI